MKDIRIELEIVGVGFVFYSPHAAAMIREGDDFLLDGFQDPEVVEEQARECKIVGVSTGSPGNFKLSFFTGYPTQDELAAREFRLRLGLEVRDGTICVRDLYDLMEWSPVCPDAQQFRAEDGFYHITLLSSEPSSGVIGDNQSIDVYLQPLDKKPELAYNGVPTLC